VSSALTVAPERVIVDEVATFLGRFVFLQRKCMYRLVALWIVSTYLHDAFQYTGYLFIHSPQRECGKTRLLEILNMLVFNSTGIDCSPTAAVLARTARNHTQLLDEGDGWPDISALRNILNAGFQKNGQTARCEQNSLNTFVPKTLLVYCPRAIAGIGQDILSETTRDRTFFVEMVRQKRDERRERMRGRLVEPEAAQLKKGIETWAQDRRDDAVARYDSLTQTQLPYLEDFRDRTIDVSEPLAVVLEMAYANHPEELAKARMELCEAIAVARDETNQYSEDHRLLNAINGMMEADELVEQPSIIAQRLNGTAGNAVNELAIGEVLRRYGFPHKSVRKEGGQPRKCYVIDRTRLRDILARYSR
jgi:hypothetical protein